MKILALDSSGQVASVAIVDNDILQAEYTINYKKTHSQTLLPMLDEVRNRLELDLSTIDAIAIASGPGSFTGLRIGAATAKGLGQALQKPLVEVPTLEGLAYNLYGTQHLVCPLMDARRNQVYTGIYEFSKIEQNTETNGWSGWEIQIVEPQCAVDIKIIIEKLNALNREVIFLGDGVPVFAEMISAELKVAFSFAPAHMNRQSAASVGTLGAFYFSQGKWIEAAEHRPEYLRMSQAEREKTEREA